MTALLNGIRVLDFTQVIAGPFCTRLLADFGADVTKIDRIPDGEQLTRSSGSPTNNVGKRSLALDLKSERGQALARDLAARADVVVENFRPGVMDDMGLGATTLAGLNPRLIYTSISGFGYDNSQSHRRAYGATAHAEAGLLWVLQQAHGDEEALAPGLQIADVVTGMNAFTAIIAALYDRTSTGTGKRIDVTLMESQLAFLGEMAAQALGGATEETWSPFRHPMHRSRDGRQFTVNIGGPHNWDRLLAGLGGPAEPFPKDPTIANTRIGELIATLDAADVARRLDDVGAPYGLVQTMPEAIRHPYFTERGVFTTVPNGDDGDLQVLRPPFRFDGQTLTPGGPPPLAGEHSMEILRDDLGIAAEAIKDLQQDGVIAVQDRPRN